MEDIHRALDEIFAETPPCPHQGIPQLTEVMIAAVEASAGRARKTTHVPFLVGHEKEAMKDREKYFVVVCPGTFRTRSYHFAKKSTDSECFL